MYFCECFINGKCECGSATLEWIHLLAYDDAKKFFKLEIYRLGSACNIKRVIVANLFKNRIYVMALYCLIIFRENITTENSFSICTHTHKRSLILPFIG